MSITYNVWLEIEAIDTETAQVIHDNLLDLPIKLFTSLDPSEIYRGLSGVMEECDFTNLIDDDLAEIKAALADFLFDQQYPSEEEQP